MRPHLRIWARQALPPMLLMWALMALYVALGSSRSLEAIVRAHSGVTRKQYVPVLGVITMLFGLFSIVMVFRANKRLSALHRRVHDREGRVCPKCYYDLPPEESDAAANAPIRCPECGQVTSEFALRREWRFYLTRQPRRR